MDKLCFAQTSPITAPIATNTLHPGLSSTGRLHKSSSTRKQLKATGQTRAERVRINSVTGSATNSPRPSIESETESSEYTSSEDGSDYSSDDDEMLDLRTLEEVSISTISTSPCCAVNQSHEANVLHFRCALSHAQRILPRLPLGMLSPSYTLQLAVVLSQMRGLRWPRSTLD